MVVIWPHQYGAAAWWGLPRGGQVHHSSLAPAGQPKLYQVTALPEVPRTCQCCRHMLDMPDTLDGTAHPCVDNHTEHGTSINTDHCQEDPQCGYSTGCSRSLSLDSNPPPCHYLSFLSTSVPLTRIYLEAQLTTKLKNSSGEMSNPHETEKEKVPTEVLHGFTFFPLCNVCSWTNFFSPLEIKELQRQLK